MGGLRPGDYARRPGPGQGAAAPRAFARRFGHALRPCPRPRLVRGGASGAALVWLRDPALPPVRLRRDHQPRPRLRRADDLARPLLRWGRRWPAVRPARYGRGRHPARGGGLHARHRRPIRPPAPEHPGPHRPRLLPRQVRRREGARGVRREAARRDGSGLSGRPPRRGGRRDGAAGPRLPLVSRTRPRSTRRDGTRRGRYWTARAGDGPQTGGGS